MPRVLYLNLVQATDGRLPQSGRTPTHVAFGATHFSERGYYLVTPDWRRHKRLLATLERVNPFGGLPSRRLVEQLTAIPGFRTADIVYAPWDISGALLAALWRHVCRVETPLVTLLHSPPFSRGPAYARPLWRAFLDGSSALPTFSGAVAQLTRRALRRPVPVPAFAMGPDPGWHRVGLGPGRGVLCSGKSLRDFELFGRAATAADVDAAIVCAPANVTNAFADFGPRVRIEGARRGLLPAATLRDRYAEARVIAIPLASTRLTAGYWTLIDALGSGRPVIMTRTPYVDLDLEAEGVGRWVEPGDQEGWVDALAWFDAHPDDAAEMGRRARALVEAGFDQPTFAHHVMDLFDSLLGIDTRDWSTGAAREYAP